MISLFIVVYFCYVIVRFNEHKYKFNWIIFNWTLICLYVDTEFSYTDDVNAVANTLTTKKEEEN